MWEGVGDRTETSIFWPPLLWPSTLCLSCSPDAQPETLDPLCWMICYILSATSQVPKLHRGSQGPFGLMWLSLPHLVYNSVSSSNCNSNSDCNWNCLSYIIVQRPLDSPLEWHDWSSSSGNNCHAVHRSLSSGASVYECIMGFTLSHSISQIHPRDLFRLLAIGMCHFLPVHHLEWHFGPGRRPKYNTVLVPITIHTIITFMFLSFFNSLTRYRYLSFFSPSFNFTL